MTDRSISAAQSQARLDALADMMTWSYQVIGSFPSTRYFELIGSDGIVERVREMLADIESGNANQARFSASKAARAAFRAVPGLRG